MVQLELVAAAFVVGLALEVFGVLVVGLDVKVRLVLVHLHPSDRTTSYLIDL